MAFLWFLNYYVIPSFYTHVSISVRRRLDWSREMFDKLSCMVLGCESRLSQGSEGRSTESSMCFPTREALKSRVSTESRKASRCKPDGGKWGRGERGRYKRPPPSSSRETVIIVNMTFNIPIWHFKYIFAKKLYRHYAFILIFIFNVDVCSVLWKVGSPCDGYLPISLDKCYQYVASH